MSETIDAVRGGAPCAKEILCLPPAKARAHIETLKAEHAARYKHILKDAMLEGFEAIGQAIRDGIGLSTEQMQCYHQCAAVLDDWPRFAEAYDALRESIIDPSVKG
jgi:alpha-beta hydrolase superfamily lysophospholipase